MGSRRLSCITTIIAGSMFTKDRFVVFDHETAGDRSKIDFHGTGNTRYATTRVKVLNAQAHGAVGVLIVGEPNRDPSNQSARRASVAR